jgi:long-subunit fatty acid transport protein
MWWWFAAVAGASSLDPVDVGGPFGSPTATDGTAAFWNPAGVAAGSGTRFHVEGAPTLATVHYDRVDPFGYEGTDTMRLTGVVPFVGVATDAGVDGLGLGLSMSLPFVRGASSTGDLPWVSEFAGDVPVTDSVGRYSARTARTDLILLLASGGWDFGPVAVGAGLGAGLNTWTATLDKTALPDLHDQIEELASSSYTDEQIEHPDYGATLEFDPLRDVAVTFNVGVRAEPVPDRVAIGLSYLHGMRVDNRGDLNLHFGCPPQDDAIGRFGVESLGLCDSTLVADARVAYRLPGRLLGSVQVKPTDRVAIEVMGGFVPWSVFRDFEIGISGVAERNDIEGSDPEATADLVNQETLWARDNRNSGWFGVDGKVDVADDVTVGGRVQYDVAAVPTDVLLTNNYDANNLMVSAMGAWRPNDRFEVGLSASRWFLASRTVEDSAFGVTLDPEARKDERFFYPHGNGTYRGGVFRFGLVVRGQFGGDGRVGPG